MPPQREIHRGPLLGEQRDRLLAAVKERLRQGRGQSVLYLTASRPMLDAVSRSLLDGRDCVGSLDGLPVHLFNGFIRRLLRTALIERDGRWVPAPRRRDISGEDYPLRRPLIAQIMRQLQQRKRLPAFGALATAGGCVASVTKLIGEITRAGKTATEFARIVEQRIARHEESLPTPDPTGADAPHPAEQVYGYERDVALVAQCYAAALEIGGLTESDYDHLRAIAALDGELDGFPCRTPFLDGVEWIIVDGFFDFTPVQGEILRRLVARAPRITFNFDDDADNPQVFAPVHETIAKVEAMGEGFVEVVFHDRAHDRAGEEAVACRPTAPGLEVLRRGLFNPSYQPPPEASGNPPPIFVATAPDVERELRFLAKTIKRYVAFDRLTPSDIAVVVRDKDAYGPHLRRILTDEAIPYTLDERLPVTDVPAVRAWLKLSAAALERSRADEPSPPAIPVGRLMDVLKSDYFAVPGYDVSADDVENVVAFVGEHLRLDDWLKRAERLADYLRSEAPANDAADDDPAADAGEAERAAAAEPTVRPDAVTAADLEVVGALLKTLGELLARIPTAGSAKAIVEAIEEVVAALGFETRLETNIRTAVGRPQALLQATLDLRGLQAVRRAVAAALDAQQLAARSIAAITGEDAAAPPPDTTLGALHADILRALDGLTLRVEPEAFGAVRILEATTVRGLHFPVVFVPGLVEGGFPLRLSGDWIYPAAERERLKEDGLTLEDISPATLAKEEHYFYQVVCRATQALHLSYPTVGAEDEELTPSSFLAEIMRLAPETRPGGRRHTIAPKGYDGASLLQATTPHELLRQTAAATARLRRGAAPDRLLSPPDDDDAPPVLSPVEQLAAVEAYLAEQGWDAATLAHRRMVEQLRYGRDWTPFDGCIVSEDLRNVLASRFGETYVFSATAFNEYGACPFRFFADRVLQLRSRVVAALDLQAAERGRLLHDILRDLYREASPHGASLDACLERLRTVAGRVFDACERRLPPLNPRLWAIEKRVLLTHLEQLLAEETARGKAAAHVTELAFGMRPPHADPHSVGAPLKLTNARGEVLQLRGQIDRIDRLRLQDGAGAKEAFVIYDYKLTRGPSVRDMAEGRDVQIAVYLAAVAACFPNLRPVAGGGYFALTKTPRCGHGLYRSDYENLLEKTYGYTFLPEAEFESAYNKIIGYLWAYRSRIRDGRFEVLPSRGRRECEFCDFPAVCRYETYRIRRKVGSPQKTSEASPSSF